MRLAPTLVAAPDSNTPAVTLAELKQHLRIDHSDEDADLAIKLSAAIAHFDGWFGVLGRCLINQQWRLALEAFPGDGMLSLRFSNVSAVVVTYADHADADQTLSAALYRLVETSAGSALVLKKGQSWPVTYERPDAVRVLVSAGFGASAASIPAPIRSAILLRAGDLYHKREDASKPGGLVDMLIAPYSRTMLGGYPT